MSIGGLLVKAMVDIGAQSTIISHSTLLSQWTPSTCAGKKSTVQLYGKDGPGGGQQLTVTAQLQLTFTVDGESVNVLVQPDSEHRELLFFVAMVSLSGTLRWPTSTYPSWFCVSQVLYM